MSSEYRLTRRGFIGAAAGAAAATAMTGPAALASTAGAPGGGGGPQRDLALINGKIHTFDEHDTVTDRVLIRDGKVAAVGSIGGGPAQVVNLRGRTVIPGLIDNHVHFVRIGQAVGHDMRRLEVAFSIEAVQQTIADYAAEVPEGEFLTALRGLALRQWASPPRHPTREELDEAAPHHPVVISQGSNGQTNTLGRDRLRDLGVTVSDAGSVNDDAAYIALSQFLTIETKKREMLRASEYALSTGLTAFMDDHGQAAGATVGAGFLDRVTGHDHVLELWREGNLPVRIRCRFAVRTGVDDPELLEIYVNNRWERFGDDMLQQSGIGEWAPRGDLYQWSLQTMANRPMIYHEHLISAGEVQGHLNALQQFEAENPQHAVADLHWSGGHLDGMTEQQVLQANQLGFGLVPQGWRYLTANAPGPNFRMIVDLATVPVGTGTDGARVAPLNPWTMVYYMTTGLNSGGAPTGEGRTITRHEALKLYAGPQQGWFSKEDDVLGGIAVGRYADLAVLDADVFDPVAVPDDRLRHMTSVLTIVDGRIAFDAGVLETA